MNRIIYLILSIFSVFMLACNSSDNEPVVASSVSGIITYAGNYSGENRTIYIRGYRENSRAVGEPDFATSINNAGTYKLDLNGYKGTLYLSAFMDIDKSGSKNGATASEVLTHGVYSDPLGCYGDYAFESTGPLEIIVDGSVSDINFNLFDSGVIKVLLSNTGHCIVGVIKTQNLSNDFLHHTYATVLSSGDAFYIAVPAGKWYCKHKYDALAAQLYSNQLSTIANSITEINF